MQKLEDTLRRFEEIASVLLIGAMTLIIAGQIVWRYFFNDPLAWSEEVTQFIMICLSFVAATAVLKRSEHYSVDVFFNMLSSWNKYLVDAISYSIQLLLVLGLAYYSFSIAKLYTGTSSVLLGIPEETKAYVMVYCFLSMAMFLGRRAVLSIQKMV